ncbi:hypothetical protein [Pseudomonas rhizophila]|jgi:hypothetical protein|uniref:hypothetical protein n=1 Tax=Pseudomonas rhizophila TaxID=2045200 RepID=UPI0030DA77B4
MSEAHCNNHPQRKALGLVTHDNTGGPFVVECQGCGEVYPSFHCLGGGQIADTGDYEDARCPHCEQVDPEECDNAALAWNTQQLKINALQEMLNQCEEQLHSLEQRRYAEQQAREAAERDAERYRWLRKVTPYRFKKIQDAAVTDGGDVMYFHSDRFDAAVDAAIEAALNLASEAESQSPAPGYAPSPQQ